MDAVHFDGRLIKRPQYQAPTASFTPGPGRILTGVYLNAGAALGDVAGRLSHKMGLGPEAVAARIHKAIEGSRQAMLDELHAALKAGRLEIASQRVHVLQKYCAKLLAYARPSESPTTQLQTFRQLISLITRYPGLRLVFVQHPDIQRLAVRDMDSEEIAELWARPQAECVGEPDYEAFRQLAAYCVSCNVLAVEVEKVEPSRLGRLSAHDRSVVEMLISCCKEDSGLSKLTATRYLGNILALSSFWHDTDLPFLRSVVVEKLFDGATQLVEDIGIVSSDGPAAVDPQFQVDMESIDLLAGSILAGIRRWIRTNAVCDLESERWFSAFINLVNLCRNPSAERLLPYSWIRAGVDWRALFVQHVDTPPPDLLPGAAEYDEVSELVEVEIDAGLLPNLHFSKTGGREHPESERAPLETLSSPQRGSSFLGPTIQPLWIASEPTLTDEIRLPVANTGIPRVASHPYDPRMSDDDTDTDWVFPEADLQAGQQPPLGRLARLRPRNWLPGRMGRGADDATTTPNGPMVASLQRRPSTPYAAGWGTSHPLHSVGSGSLPPPSPPLNDLAEVDRWEFGNLFAPVDFESTPTTPTSPTHSDTSEAISRSESPPIIQIGPLPPLPLSRIRYPDPYPPSLPLASNTSRSPSPRSLTSELPDGWSPQEPNPGYIHPSRPSHYRSFRARQRSDSDLPLGGFESSSPVNDPVSDLGSDGVYRWRQTRRLRSDSLNTNLWSRVKRRVSDMMVVEWH